MAIIYETKEDFERDKLKDQAKDMELKAEKQSGLGLAFVIGGTIVDYLNKKGSSGLRWTSTALNIVGFVEVVKSMFTSHKAHDLKLQRERMGPQEVIIKGDVPPAEVLEMAAAHGEKPCSHCDHHKPKTLLEHAEKGDVAPVR